MGKHIAEGSRYWTRRLSNAKLRLERQTIVGRAVWFIILILFCKSRAYTLDLNKLSSRYLFNFRAIDLNYRRKIVRSRNVSDKNFLPPLYAQWPSGISQLASFSYNSWIDPSYFFYFDENSQIAPEPLTKVLFFISNYLNSLELARIKCLARRGKNCFILRKFKSPVQLTFKYIYLLLIFVRPSRSWWQIFLPKPFRACYWIDRIWGMRKGTFE